MIESMEETVERLACLVEKFQDTAKYFDKEARKIHEEIVQIRENTERLLK